METIDPKNLILKIIPIFNELGIRYFITGGYAVSVWGRPRTTFDVDIVVELIEPQVKPLAVALRKISEAGYIDEDTAKEAIRNKSEFNFIDPDTGLKVDFWISKGDKMSSEEYKRRIAYKINNEEVYFISPEDLILSKLRWHNQDVSSRHIEDIESVFKISGDKLDKKYLIKKSKGQEYEELLMELLKKYSS